MRSRLFLIAESKKKEDDMKKFTLLSLLVLIVITLFLGCNAARGVGQDLEDAGGHIGNIGE